MDLWRLFLVVINLGVKLYIGMIIGDVVALKSVDDCSNLC